MYHDIMNPRSTENYYESLFLRLLAGEISAEEYEELDAWFAESEEHRKTLTDLYRVRYAVDTVQTMQGIDSLGALHSVNRVLRTRRNRRIRRLVAGAAACAAVIAVAGVLIMRGPEGVPAVAGSETLSAIGNEVMLVLSGSEVVALEGDAPEVKYAGDGRLTSGSQVIDHAPQPQAVTHHQLIVPKGKRSVMALPDGTRVWINADSRLVFPSSFTGELREVTVEGEVYFDVAADPSKPFVVRTENFDVTVLGTAFNICAYAEDVSQSVMLARGSVSVSHGLSKTELIPNQMLIMMEDAVALKTVDPEDHASWTTGVYRFRSEPLKEIGERLSRYYGKPVVIQNADVASVRCSGKLELNDAPEKVYESLARAAGVEYVDHGEYVEFRAHGTR